jgi:hypothetical protein
MAKSVAEVYIGDKMAPQEAKQSAAEIKYVTMDANRLEEFVGVYPLPKIDQTLTVVVKDGKLWAAGGQPLELHPIDHDRFYCKELQADIVFSPQEQGGMHVKISQPGAVNEGDRVPAAAVTTDFLPYTGVYWSDELETQYTFLVRDGALYARHAHHGEVALVLTGKDQFFTGWWFAPNVKFVRDAAGNISGVTLGGGRVAAVAFTRKAGPAIKEVSRQKLAEH